VAICIRKILGIGNSGSNQASVGKFSRKIRLFEQTSEDVNICVLIVIAWLVGINWVERVIIFRLASVFYVLFYHLFVNILVKWPKSLRTNDVLFLIRG